MRLRERYPQWAASTAVAGSSAGAIIGAGACSGLDRAEMGLRDGKFIVGVKTYRTRRAMLYKLCKRERDYRAQRAMQMDAWMTAFIAANASAKTVAAGAKTEGEDAPRIPG